MILFQARCFCLPRKKVQMTQDAFKCMVMENCFILQMFSQQEYYLRMLVLTYLVYKS